MVLKWESLLAASATTSATTPTTAGVSGIPTSGVSGIPASVISGVPTVVVIIVIAIVACIVSSSITSSDLKLDTIILRTPLRNGHQNRLMVRRTNHRASPVHAGGKTAGHHCRELTVVISGLIHALEEGELARVRRGGGPEVTDILDGDVGVADDIAIAGEFLRG